MLGAVIPRVFFQKWFDPPDDFQFISLFLNSVSYRRDTFVLEACRTITSQDTNTNTGDSNNPHYPSQLMTITTTTIFG